MTTQEEKELLELYRNHTWDFRKVFYEWLQNAEITEEKKGKRTGQQNRALHLWFRQIAEACRDAGIDGRMLMAETISVEVNENIVKGMWQALQQALYNKKSTADLDKVGEIEHLQEHFIRFFGENFGLELPPWPHEEFKGVRLSQMENMKKVDYPDQDFEEPLI